MKRFAAALLLTSCLLAQQAWAGSASQSPDMAPLQVGKSIGELVFTGPLEAEAARQLGVKPGTPTVALKDVRPGALILVVYSMYCPFCQKEGPKLAALRELIAARGLEGKIALAGLAAGNSVYEVKTYRDAFKLTIPLFPDQDFALYKTLGRVGTPFFYVLKRQGHEFVVVDTMLGCMESPQIFLDQALKAAGIR